MPARIDFLARALAHHRAGELAEAEQNYRRLLEVEPYHAQALYRLALLRADLGDQLEALDLFRRAIDVEPANADFQLDYGLLLSQAGHPERAIDAYRLAVQARPDFAEAHNILGAALRRMGELDLAIQCYRRAIELQPEFAEAYNNWGVALQDQGLFPDAAWAYRQSLRIRSDLADPYCNLANVLRKLGQDLESLPMLDRAIALRPHFPEAHNYRGRALLAVGDHQAAILAHQQAIQLRPHFPEAYYDLGCVFEAIGQPFFAAQAYRQAYALEPAYVQALDGLVHQLQHLCEWKELEPLARKLTQAMVADRRSSEPAPMIAPFSILSLHTPTTAEEQFNCARNWCRQSKFPHRPRPQARSTPARLRIGYLSSDFREHPVSYLMSEWIEAHDRSRFEIFGYSIGPEDRSSVGQRILTAFDTVQSLRRLGNVDAAERIQRDQIDILVDLNGLTQHARTEILALRPAPIAVSYLGYPGTTGADFIDYILVDEFVVPASQQPFYSERLVHLPGCYLVNDSRREVASPIPRRSEVGLPEDAFVFCAFSAPYKISSQMFDVWMRLLHAVPDSRLWLRDSNPWATDNLRRSAALHGLTAERLIFAPKVAMPEHLARHAVADLFLDTYPYNQHSTASDALRMGLPVVTLSGETFASRVSGSLLQTLGLPELIAYRLQDYESIIRRLAADRGQLSRIRRQLEGQLQKSDLLDGRAFARKLEQAYLAMWEMLQRHEPPRAFVVSKLNELP